MIPVSQADFMGNNCKLSSPLFRSKYFFLKEQGYKVTVIFFAVLRHLHFSITMYFRLLVLSGIIMLSVYFQYIIFLFLKMWVCAWTMCDTVGVICMNADSFHLGQ